MNLTDRRELATELEMWTCRARGFSVDGWSSRENQCEEHFSLEAYKAGLESIIGLPSEDVLGEMAREHTLYSYSKGPWRHRSEPFERGYFQVSNYGTKTTPRWLEPSILYLGVVVESWLQDRVGLCCAW